MLEKFLSFAVNTQCDGLAVSEMLEKRVVELEILLFAILCSGGSPLWGGTWALFVCFFKLFIVKKCKHVPKREYGNEPSFLHYPAQSLSTMASASAHVPLPTSPSPALLSGVLGIWCHL